MDNNPTRGPEPDWSLLRAFLEVAERGSISRAASALGSSQPTVSRQIATLEAQLGQALFERTTRGVALTEAGAALAVPARGMRAQAREFGVMAAGRSQSLAGTVRLTASEIMSAYLLPDLLRSLRATHPDIEIELVASNTVEDLLARDADIALRMVQPTQGTLIARRLADQPLGLYASRAYLDVHGRPSRDDMLSHQWVGYDRNDQLLRGFREAGFEVDKHLFGLRCDNLIVGWHAVLAGLGIGVGMERVAALAPQLERVLPQVRIPPLPLWLTAHRELRGTPRLAAVFEHLAAALAAG